MTSTMTIGKNGNKLWDNEQGDLHRIDGPAVEWTDGDKWWYIDGIWINCLVRELLSKSPFGDDVHLGILAEYFADRGDFRLLDIVSPYLTGKS